MKRQTALALLCLCPMLASPWAFASDGAHIERDELEAAFAAGVESALRDVMAAIPPARHTVEREIVKRRVVEKVLVEPEVRESFSAGVSDDSSDGCDIAAVSVAYEREQDGLHVHGRYTRGGNLACKPASSIDVSVEPSWGMFSLEVGHDRHAVSVQEVVEGNRVVWYGAAEATIVALNLDHTFTRTISEAGQPDRTVDLFNGEIGFDAVNDAPRAALSTRIPMPAVPLPGGGSVELNELALDWDAVRFPGEGLMQSVRASLSFDVGNDWALGMYLSRTYGLHNVPDPIAWRNDARLTGGPGAPPRRAKAFGVEAKRQL